MERAFEKLHGLGNDFVFFDGRDDGFDPTSEQVRWLCDRHEGIGADGVIVVQPPRQPGTDAYMHYVNADGTLAQMCGNGVRCFAKYLVDHRIVDPSAGELVAGTLAGPRPIRFAVDDRGQLVEATVAMGQPVLAPEAVPVAAPADALAPSGTPYVAALELDSPFGAFSFACVSMGNPHAVCFVDDWEALPDALFAGSGPKGLPAFDVARVGAFFEAHPAFPDKANVEFATVGDGVIAMRVFERGCGETMACGTGACATAVAAALTGRAGRESEVILRGGTLRICLEGDGSVLMTGPAKRSFSGVVDL